MWGCFCTGTFYTRGVDNVAVILTVTVVTGHSFGALFCDALQQVVGGVAQQLAAGFNQQPGATGMPVLTQVDPACGHTCQPLVWGPSGAVFGIN